MRTYELPCDEGEVEDYVEREIVEPLGRLGYVVDRRDRWSIALLGLRRPRWAIALAVFLFPVGLLLLLIERPREVRLRWGRATTVELSSDDQAARHLVAAAATEQGGRPGHFEKGAAPFAAGALSVLAAWPVGVQMAGTVLAFGAAIFAAMLLGVGVGTAIALRRASHWEDPPGALAWGTVPALLGAMAMTAVFVLLVLFLLAVGAGS